jgi:hypothetical protein
VFAAVVTLSATLAFGAFPAAASTSPATLRAKAAAIAAKITQDDATLNALGSDYLADRATLQEETAAARASGVVVRRLNGVVAKDRHSASVAAAAAYVDAGSSTELGVYLAQRPDELVQTSTYLNSALAILKNAAANYARAEASRKAALGRELRAAGDAQAALAATTSERTAVLATLAREQQLEKSINGQIAALVAEEVAARLAAQRAAAAKAAAAAAAAAATPVPAGPPAATTTVTTGALAPTSLAADFAALRDCESSGNYQDNTGNGYYGAYQFSLSTWLGLGESGLPSTAAPAVQDAAAYELYRQRGWAPWPACSAILGL